MQSVLDQEGVDVRAIIVDDASTDDTAQIAKALAVEDSRVIFLRNEVNLRQIATYNRGLERTDADYVLLLSADDYLVPGALTRAADVLDAHPNVGLLFGRASALMEDGTTLPMRPLFGDQMLSGRQYLERFAGTNPIPTPTAIVRTTVQHTVGFYDPTLPHSGDMEMWMRIAARSDIAYLDVEQAVYRQHKGNMSRSYFSAMLPDIEQRLLAIDTFLTANAHRLTEVDRLQGLMKHRLAANAVANASAAFNTRNFQLCELMRRKALEIDPGIRHALGWYKLDLKRLMGARLWTALSALQRSIVS